MSPEEKQKQREADATERKRRLKHAWQKMAASPEFQLIFEKDIQIEFNPFSPSFLASEGFNPHAAACRDGHRQVIAHIHKQILKANKSD